MQSIQSKNTKKPLKKILIIIICGLLLVGAGASAYVYGFKGNLLGWSAAGDDQYTNDDTQANGESENNTKTDNNLQEDTVDNGEGKPTTNPDDTPADGQNTPNSSNTLSASITAANQNGNVLQIRTLIEDIVSSGSCTLNLTQGSKKVTKSASTQALPNSSTCQGFDVATSELAPGAWTITIDITASGKTAHLTKTVTIN